MKTLVCGVVFAAVVATAGVATSGVAADRPAELQPPAMAQFSHSPVPASALPWWHQNHCGLINGHYVCADHCGAGYQVYFCPTSLSGCCHVGYGYCDAAGRLRCGPPWFDFSSILP